MASAFGTSFITYFGKTVSKFEQQINKLCDVCPLSKSTRLPFPSSTSYSVKPFDLVHSDVWGLIIKSFDGYKYFVTFVDDFSRFTWLYLLKAKSEVATVFQDFHHLVHTQFSSQIKILQSDNGSEYMSNT